ncbi:MAG: iron hydrogenase [Myxococcales bacterium]|nr:MAG: iron hydrogenase [Myxococcales bacterium]
MQTIDNDNLRRDVEAVAEKYGRKRASLMPLLQTLQAKYGYISGPAMQTAAEVLDIRPVEVYDTVSFYSFFRTEKSARYTIRLCQTISCDMKNKQRIARQLENELGVKFGQATPDGAFALEYANCLGMCDQGPAMLVNDRMYVKVTPEKVAEIVSECRSHFGAYKPGLYDFEPNLREGGPLLSGASAPNAGLRVALAKPRVDVINAVRQSGLRGRGGAGFPTATKWQLAAAAKGEQKFVVCNADEGEPGTFKDRLLLLDFTDPMFEGMTIAGYAIGATKGIVYLRGEYAFLRERLEDVLAKRRKAGLLGKGVLGKAGFEFDIEIRMGAGAYVCGEETALIESLEGKRGEPRNRPPFPVNTGLDGCPTSVNNVETFVACAMILDKGADWFKKQGTEKSTGTKLFSVSGDCATPGVYEFPMGITVAELLRAVGGENAKAVQVGGASGVCVPASQFARQIAFEDAAPGGSIIVFGPKRDMLHVAENFMGFFAEESCGQCVPCRIGCAKLLEGVRMLQRGECSMAHLNELKGLSQTMKIASKCGLGQTASNAFMSIVNHFGDEVFGRQAE